MVASSILSFQIMSHCVPNMPIRELLLNVKAFSNRKLFVSKNSPCTAAYIQMLRKPLKADTRERIQPIEAFICYT